TNAQSGYITVVAPAGSSASSNVFVVSYLSDLVVSLSASANPIFVGSNLTYTLLITNAGPLDAPSASLNDTLPASVSFKSATTSQGTISPNATGVVGNFGTLPVGGLVTVTIVVTPQSIGNITNNATVTSS